MKKIMIPLMLLTLTACKSNDFTYYEEEIPYNKILVEKQEEIKDLSSTNDLASARVIINPYEINPLSCVISFTLDYESPVTLTIKGKDELTTLSHTFSSAKAHTIPVYGLYLGNNEVIIKTNREEQTFKIKTSLSEDYIKKNQIQLKAKVNVKDESKLDESLYFLSPSGLTNPVAYDVNGDLRWLLDLKSTWDFKINSDGLLIISTDRLVNPMYYTSGFYLIDFLGKVYAEYTIDNGYHHDLFEMANGNYLVCSNDFSKETVEDVIVEIDKKGNVLRTIDLKDILDPLTSKAISWVNYDWFHNNSIYYDKYNNLIILSGRHQDSVVALDYDTLELVYILGDPSTYSSEYQKYLLKPTSDLTWFYHQHAAKVIDKNHLMLFDNGNYKAKKEEDAINKDENYSRAIIYEINLDEMSVKEVYSYGKDRGVSYYSPYISDVDYLGNNRLIVHSGGIVEKDGKPTNFPAGLAPFDTLRAYTTEIVNGNVVFELETANNYYRAEKINLYDHVMQDFDHVATRLGGFSEKDYILKKADKPSKKDEEYEKYQIKVYEEKDRITFSGVFSSGTLVNIYLENENESRCYNWRISKKPYTSLCVNTFSDANLACYIETKGLNGTYNIKLEINNKVYDLEKSVTVGGQND